MPSNSIKFLRIWFLFLEFMKFLNKDSMPEGLKNTNKTIAHMAVLVTFIALVGLFMPLKSAIVDNRMLSIIRVSLMILSGIVAMITFVNSFIQARKNK